MKFYENKTILVTGGSGYIGSSLIRKLAETHCKILVLDRVPLKHKSFAHQKAKLKVIEGDITQKDIWERVLKGVDIVFHFAAQTSVYKANEKPSQDLTINLKPLLNLVETCQEKNLRPTIIFSGTVTQVGITKEYPINEDRPDNPVTIYDIHKLASEKYLHYYTTALGGKAVTLRLANVYGPGPQSSSPDRGILNLFIRKALAGEDLTIYGKGDFVRDYSYIDDFVAAFLLAGAKIKKTSGKYYVLGSGHGYTFNEVVALLQKKVERITKHKVQIKHIKAPEGLSPIESRNFVADTRKFREDTGWKRKVSLTKGIDHTISYFLEES